MASGKEPALPPSAPQGTAEGGRGVSTQVSTQRHSYGADGARPNHVALACREYGLLVPEGLAGDPATAGPYWSRDNPEDTTGTGYTNGM